MTWGDEVLRTPPEHEFRAMVQPGELAFSPEGKRECDRLRPYPDVPSATSTDSPALQHGGKALDDVRRLKSARAGASIRVEHPD